MHKKTTPKFILSIILFVIFFCSKVNGQQNTKLINSYLATEREKNGWLPGDIQDWVISDQSPDKSTGFNHTYIQQRHKEIIVYNAISVFLIKDDKIIYFKPGLIDHLENKVNADRPSINSRDAIVLL